MYVVKRWKPSCCAVLKGHSVSDTAFRISLTDAGFGDATWPHFGGGRIDGRWQLPREGLSERAIALSW